MLVYNVTNKLIEKQDLQTLLFIPYNYIYVIIFIEIQLKFMNLLLSEI